MLKPLSLKEHHLLISRIQHVFISILMRGASRIFRIIKIYCMSSAIIRGEKRAETAGYQEEKLMKNKTKKDVLNK